MSSRDGDVDGGGGGRRRRRSFTFTTNPVPARSEEATSGAKEDEKRSEVERLNIMEGKKQMQRERERELGHHKVEVSISTMVQKGMCLSIAQWNELTNLMVIDLNNSQRFGSVRFGSGRECQHQAGLKPNHLKHLKLEPV